MSRVESMEIDYFIDDENLSENNRKRSRSDDDQDDLINGHNGGCMPSTSKSADLNHVKCSSSSTGATTSRKYLKAKRITSKTDHNHYLILVLDTNILIEDLNILKQLILNNKYARDSNKISKIIIPYNVIDELDGLKYEKSNVNLLKKVQNAIRFINEQLKLNDQLIQCMKKYEDRSVDDNNNDTNNDDLILKFCLKLKEKPEEFLETADHFGQRSINDAHNQLILVTNDRNLQNKAIINRMNCMTMEELLKKFKFKSIANYKNENIGKSTISTAKTTTAETTRTSKVEIEKELKKFENRTFPSSKRFRSNNSNNNTKSNNSKLIDEIKSKLKNMNKSKMDYENQNEIDLRYSLETQLSEFLVKATKDTFGDDELCTAILGDYTPNHATLKESLRMLKKNWLGVYSEYFGRDRKILEIVNDLLRSKDSDISDNSKNCEILLNKLEAVLKQMKK